MWQDNGFALSEVLVSLLIFTSISLSLMSFQTHLVQRFHFYLNYLSASVELNNGIESYLYGEPSPYMAVKTIGNQITFSVTVGPNDLSLSRTQ